MKKKIIKFMSFGFLGMFGCFIIFNLIGFLYAFITPKLDIKTANAFSVFDNKGNLIF